MDFCSSKYSDEYIDADAKNTKEHKLIDDVMVTFDYTTVRQEYNAGLFLLESNLTQQE